MKQTDYDIVIVGAGLVGATLAAAIIDDPANQSLSIALVDQAEAPASIDISQQPPEFDPRVVALTHASIALLKKINVWESILEQRACPYRHMKVWDDEGTGNIAFHADELGQSELGFIVENTVVLNAVLEKITDHPQLTLIRGHAPQCLSTKMGHQYVTLSDGCVIKASLLIAADGAHSAVRELVGLKMRSWSYQHKAIVATVKSELPHQFTAWQNFLTTGPLAFLPLADASAQYSSIVWSIENEEADKLMELSDNEFAQAVSQAFEHTLGEVQSVSKRFCFPLVQRHALDYIAPQLALVGDAAHTIHPLAGQGVNLGLLDVQALSAEIARASLRRLPLGDASLLRRYQRKRKKNNLDVMLLMESFKRLFGSRTLALRWLRNNGLRSINKIKPVKNWLARQAMGL